MNQKLGPTGDFPEGKLNPSDEGGLNIGVAFDPSTQQVIINFGTPVRWIAMSPQQAKDFASLIISKAKRRR